MTSVEAATAAPPRGFRDILPTEARELRAIERSLGETFSSYGYVPLDPPTVERSNGGSILGGDRLMRFLDRDGALIALRPDITTAIARLVAQRYADASGALRLCYFAPVFREEPAMLGTEREYVQAGAELVGPSGALADAEALALLAESLACAGLHDQTVEVGHVGLVRALFDGCATTRVRWCSTPSATAITWVPWPAPAPRACPRPGSNARGARSRRGVFASSTRLTYRAATSSAK